MTTDWVRNVSEIPQISAGKRERLEEVTGQYAFRATRYYLDLIDWDDPADPIKRLIVPDTDELDEWGELDPCDEASNTQLHGVQHKYPDTALFLVTNNCAALCRYCFRKRLFIKENRETDPDLGKAIEYIKSKPEITDVLLTGGDPLTMPTKKLALILGALKDMEHVKLVRIGSKTPAFNPQRIINDPDLHNAVADFTSSGKTLYLMIHFDHPRELTPTAAKAIRILQSRGVIFANQCPIVRGVNDNPKVLRKLFQDMTALGVAPYYLFQGRPTKGNAPYRVPIVEGYHIFHEAVKDLSGLAKRARFVMSHSTGKVEIVGVDDSRIYMRYHRAKNPDDRERFMAFHRDDSANWLDDLTPVDQWQEEESLFTTIPNC